MSGDRFIRLATATVVCAVAGFAAVVSYSHIYGLGRAHGQDGTAARLLPLSVDGLILAASLVLLHEARNDRDTPPLARLMLWLGIGATVGANIAYGAGYGLLGALISAWPAVAFIGSVEIAMQQVRRARGPHSATSAPAVPQVPGDVEQAVRAAYAASVTAGQPLSQRAMADRFGLSRRKVSQIVTQAAVEGNGHVPAGEAAALNQYGATVKRHWARFLPVVYAEIRDPGSFFGVLGEQIARQIDELSGELAGDDTPGEGYLATVERLTAARCRAEEIVMYNYGLLTLGDEDEDDEPAAARDRPVVVERDHPFWEQVDAEQRERIGDRPARTVGHDRASTDPSSGSGCLKA